jgi:hypothetical protein
MTAMRQLGVGAPGGAEALGIFQQLLYDLWQSGALERPIARVKVDEKNCFGMLEWPAIREATLQTLPRHHAATCWKHAAASEVEQDGVPPAQKDRGAEQGDVDGPLECSLTLGQVAASARRELHSAQRRGELPWAVSDADSIREAEQEFDDVLARQQAWAALPPFQRRATEGGKLVTPSPAHAVQAMDGVADFWFLDDGDILCDPRLVVPLLHQFDAVNARVGAERNQEKTEVLYFANASALT